MITIGSLVCYNGINAKVIADQGTYWQLYRFDTGQYPVVLKSSVTEGQCGTTPPTTTTPTVSQLNYVWQTTNLLITWTQNSVFTVKVKVDGIVFNTISGVFGYNQTILSGVAKSNSHSICVDPI